MPLARRNQMRMQQSKFPVTASLAGAATFGALAYLIGLVIPSAIQPPFPILIYLKFDPSEIIDITSLLIFGPAVGVVTATIHFIILTVTSGNPFGPSLKYLGVLSTYLGIILAARFGKHNLLKTGLLATAFGIIARASLMTAVNYVYFIYLAQTAFGINYQGFAQGVLQGAGFNVEGLQLVYIILGLTAIYNGIHAILSIVGSLIITVALVTRAPQMFEARSWLTKKLLLVRSSPVNKENKPISA
jgi:riboflavin transporter FmnP